MKKIFFGIFLLTSISSFAQNSVFVIDSNSGPLVIEKNEYGPCNKSEVAIYHKNVYSNWKESRYDISERDLSAEIHQDVFRLRGGDHGLNIIVSNRKVLCNSKSDTSVKITLKQGKSILVLKTPALSKKSSEFVPNVTNFTVELKVNRK